MAIFRFCQNGTFEPMHEIQVFLAENILLKHYENGNRKFVSYHDPGSTKSKIYAGKSTKRGFSKKALTEIEKKNVLGSNESFEAWNPKLEAASFFTF